MSDCLFCKIIAGEIPADIVYQDDTALAFKDINPQAPVHFLVIPKKHIATLADAEDDDELLLGHLLRVVTKLAEKEGYTEPGFRTVVNTNAGAGQTVFHIHVHLLAGRPFQWPPG
jgi:histidine triad (HIT) family protein